MTSVRATSLFTVALLALSGVLSARADSRPQQALRAAHKAHDPKTFVETLDEWIYADLVVDSSRGESSPPPPERPLLALRELHRSLGRAACLVALHGVGQEAFLVAITGREIQSAIVADPRLPVMLTLFLKSCADPVAPVDYEAASTLWQILLEPLATTFQTTRQLVIVPSGTLRAVSFEALLTSEDSNDQLDATELPFAVRRFVISYEPTIGSRLGWATAHVGPARRLHADEKVLPPNLDPPMAPGSVLGIETDDARTAFLLALHLNRNGARGVFSAPASLWKGAWRGFLRTSQGATRPLARSHRSSTLTRIRETDRQGQLFGERLFGGRS